MFSKCCYLGQSFKWGKTKFNLIKVRISTTPLIFCVSRIPNLVTSNSSWRNLSTLDSSTKKKWKVRLNALQLIQGKFLRILNILRIHLEYSVRLAEKCNGFRIMETNNNIHTTLPKENLIKYFVDKNLMHFHKEMDKLLWISRALFKESFENA